MKKAILDTSFILTCVKQKIDFFDDMEKAGIQILIPKQVIVELKGVDKSGLALRILEKNKYEEVDLGTKYVDAGIAEYANKHPEIFVATLDKELKKKV
ncbi:hypothetical protein ACFLZJ_01735, partial [Nanoarchaeota archaeon]